MSTCPAADTTRAVDCIVRVEGNAPHQRYIADIVRGHKSPHDPAGVAFEFAALAKEYHIFKIYGDAYSGEWVARAYQTAGVQYEQAEKTRSELYLEGLPLFARGLVSIPDHKQLIHELRLLERRVARSGKDSVNHPTGGGATDDYANALFGALSLAAGGPQLIDWASVVGELIADSAEYAAMRRLQHRSSIGDRRARRGLAY